MQSNSPNADDSEKRRYWHPYLVALYPVANLYVANYLAVALSDVVLPMLVVLVFSFVVYTAWSRFCSDSEKAAIAASWTIGAFFSYALLSRLFDFIQRRALDYYSARHGEYVLVVWGVLWLVGLFCILKTSRQLQPINGFLNSMAIILLTISAAMLGHQWYADRHYARDGASAPWAEEPVSLTKPSQPPDIYYLVFDRYAGDETLLGKFQLDNSEFFEQLRSRGFTVASDSRANYPRTSFSMASALNMCYLPDDVQSDNYYSLMIGNHSVGRSLVAIGYKYHHFGNWFQPLRTNKNAHKVFATSALPSEYAAVLYATTPLNKVLWRQHKYQFVIEKFKQLAELAKEERPTFAYAHFLLPHPPYVLDRDGSELPWTQTRYGDPKENYGRQLQGTNKLIIRMIDKIRDSSQRTPIIILQADEGPYLSNHDRTLDRMHQILIRSRILTAFLLPTSDGTPAISQSISPVNTFRLIFREYFGAEIDLLPDRNYYWDHEDKYGRPASQMERFVDVTSLIAH